MDLISSDLRLSIIIVVYNSENVLFDCLDSISEYENLENIEVIIVDNYLNSSFNKSALKQYEYEISYIKSEVNGGFGYGNNIGAARAKYDVLLFLNPDTILTRELSSPTIKVFANCRSSTIVGYNLIDSDGRRNNTFGHFLQSNLLVVFMLHVVRYFSCYGLLNHVLNRFVWPWGAAFAVRKDVFTKAGGFDENMFLCNEEPDLLMRINNRKVRFLNIPIIHLEGHTTAISVARHKEYFKSAFYHLNKHGLNVHDFIRRFMILYNLKKLCGRLDNVTEDKLSALREIEMEHANK